MKRATHKSIRGAALGLLTAGAMFTGDNALAQTAYPSAEAAAEALVFSISISDEDELRRILGPDFRRYIPRDSVAREDVYAFLAAWYKHHEVRSTGPSTAALVVGSHDWSFPAPIVKGAEGWQFDVRQGVKEMHRRRIERNESAALGTLQVLCEAQEAFRSSVGDGRPATRILSSEGAYDGLYWEASAQEPGPSPLTDDALVMGADVPAQAALHGYRYAMLTPVDASGCSFAAWPASYGTSGRHSFLIDSGMKVSERDFGRQSTAADFSRNQREMNKGWVAVSP